MAVEPTHRYAVLMSDGREVHGTDCFSKDAMEEYCRALGAFTVGVVPISDFDRRMPAYIVPAPSPELAA